jgi:phospholipid transport system substrate-binding protein
MAGRSPFAKRSKAIIVPAAVLLVLVLLRAACAASPGDEIRDAFSAANRVLSDASMRDQPMERLNTILGIVARVFAFREAAELALGREWHARTVVEQEEFMRLFANLLERSFVFTLASRARLEGGVQMRELGESIGADGATVRTTVRSRDGNQISLEYRMVPRGDRWMIRDVVVDGVSVVASYHAQIRRIIAGSSFPELVDRMRAKVDELSNVVAVVPDGDPLRATAIAGLPRVDGVITAPASATAPATHATGVSQAAIVEPVTVKSVAATAYTPGEAQARGAPKPAAETSAPVLPVVHETRAPTEARVASNGSASARGALEPAPRYWVQVGAFQNPEAARRLTADLRRRNLPVSIGSADPHDGARLSRVRVGPFSERAAAVTMLRKLEQQGFKPFVHGSSSAQ